MSASTSDAATAAITAAASGRYMRPSMPAHPEQRQEDRDDDRGRERDRPADLDAPRRARLRAGGSPRALARAGAATFSTTMIAASTSRPTAIASPPSVIVLSPTPSAREHDARERDRERQRERDEQRRAQIAEQREQHDARRAPRRASTARPTPPSATPTSSRLVVDDAQLARPAGAPARISAIAARTPAATVDGVGAELLDDAAAHDLAAQPVRDAAPHRGRLAHVGDVAEQDRRAAAHRDHGGAQVLDGVRARPTARTVHSIGPCTTKPPAAFCVRAPRPRAAPRRA